MRRRLICEQVKLERYTWGPRRWWLVDGQLHRSDGGPAIENAKSGYCAWWEWDRFVRSNRETLANWSVG